MRHEKIMRTLIAAALVLMLLGSAGLASFKVKINSSSAKVYQTPDTDAAHVNGVAGVTLKCTAYSGDWARVEYKGKTGYMKIAALNLTDRVKAYAKASVSVYQEASSSKKLGTLNMGSMVYAVGYENGYVRIQNKSGTATAYVKPEYLSKNKVKVDTSSGASKLSKLLSTAKAQLGKPYGSSAPNKFNCSSLVKYCYSQIGYSMQSTAAKQATDDRLLKITSVSDLKAGDVLCFDTDQDGTCDHVGLFVKGDMYVEASHGAGVVRTNELNSYYRRVFMWARRVK